MSKDVYTDLLDAWKQRMGYILRGYPDEAQQVWGDAFRKWYPRYSHETGRILHSYHGGDHRMIEWKFREDGGSDCIVAGTMYFEDTATGEYRKELALVRVPK